MYSRQDAFRNKFSSAAEQLSAPPEQLVSLKLRENIGSHSEYQELLNALTQEAGVRSTRIQGDFQGSAHLVENSKTKVIVVEHETGLEILYIAGSVASLVGIVPMILRCWNALSGSRGRHHPPRGCGIETRQFDGDGNLIENHSYAMDVHWASPLSAMNSVLLTVAENIDAETHRLRQSVKLLADRVTALEGLKLKAKIPRATKATKKAGGGHGKAR